jgi:hypothetical protein
VINAAIKRVSPKALNFLLVGTPFVAWVCGSLAYKSGMSLPSCPVKALTGLDCPGCGATRAGASLLRGDIAAALDHHALLVLGPALIALLWLLSRKVPALRSLWIKVTSRSALTAGLVIGVFWALRLLPIAPFHALASGRL